MENIDLNKIYEKSQLKWLKDSTIYVSVAGSHSYGMNTATSDVDIRGISMVPKNYLFGILDTFEQAVFSEPYDTTIFALKKFIKLAIDFNPNCAELLFTDESDHLYINDIGKSLLDIRDLFISKKARWTFSGYSRAQLKRINTHRSWLQQKNTIKNPERKDFGLPETNKLIPEEQILEIEAAIRKKVDEWNFDTSGMDDATSIKFKQEVTDVLLDLKLNSEMFDEYALKSLGLDSNLTEAFQKERAYKAAKRNYKNFLEWKENRNKERYALEEKYGMDCKHVSHLVRLYRECIELLETGKLNVKRPDAKELLEIRNGSWNYEKVIEFADKSDKILEELYKTSKIPNEPDRIKINNWLIRTTEDYLNK